MRSPTSTLVIDLAALADLSAPHQRRALPHALVQLRARCLAARTRAHEAALGPLWRSSGSSRGGRW